MKGRNNFIGISDQLHRDPLKRSECEYNVELSVACLLRASLEL